MSIFNLIRLALLALQRNKLRAFLTMLGIIIGVAAVIAMVAIGQGSKESIQTQLGNMGSNMVTILPSSNVAGGARMDASTIQTLTLPDVIALQKQATLLTAVSPVSSIKGQAIFGPFNWPTTLQGGNTDYFDIRKLSVADGIAYSESDVASAAKVCLLGKTVVDNLFPSGESPIGKVIRFNTIPLQVIGTLVPKGVSSFGQDQDDIIVAPYTTIQKRMLATIYLQNIIASAVSEEQSDAAVDQVTSILRETHRLRQGDDNNFTVRTMAELIKTLSSTTSLLTILLTAIAGISLIIGGIGIMNIMYVSVTERTREIGLRMSIGARGIDILLQFLVEAIIISITGGVIGVILGVSASTIITLTLGWPTLVSRSSIILSFMVCALTGVFFGYYPALKASRLDPIEALRYE
ncbi:putative ABC transport system permease protein [Chitinophaga dinghuensis]|uniref:Putative ABC transport system permease protein n=1 Tax=Chitinophaga dinghuensis TaxID=1539050 RepID=A0A327VQB2_9BACT|nr:ABC transporter permease [Chitinophaga dinghuensis]RAJ76537.1 putative ABC transport system permease protein [Chitinophaga dinghuensis]